MEYRDYYDNKITYKSFMIDNFYPHLMAICLLFIGVVFYNLEDMESLGDISLFLSIPCIALLGLIIGSKAHWDNYKKTLYKK